MTDIDTIKGYFNTGDIPTESNFSTLIDETYNRDAFYPEKFGAVGDGSTDDRAALQLAIDAASTNGGIIKLTRNYALASWGGNTDLGGYTDFDYMLHIDADNVWFEGPGKISLTALPTTTSDKKALIIFGNGGSDDGSYTQDAGTWTYNVGMRGVTIDCTALTKAQLESIRCTGVLFSYCSGFFFENCITWRMMGDYLAGGSIAGNMSSKFGSVKNNKLINSIGSLAILLDGSRGSVIKGNRVIQTWTVSDELAGSGYNKGGIAIFHNTDNQISAENNVITGNVIRNCALGITIKNQDICTNNVVYSVSTGNGISAISLSQGNGEYPSSNGIIANNKIGRAGSAGYGVHLYGESSSTYNGTTNPASGWLVTGNHISGSWVASIHMGVQAENNVVVGNMLNGGSVTEDATASGNTTTPNY